MAFWLIPQTSSEMKSCPDLSLLVVCAPGDTKWVSSIDWRTLSSFIQHQTRLPGKHDYAESHGYIRKLLYVAESTVITFGAYLLVLCRTEAPFIPIGNVTHPSNSIGFVQSRRYLICLIACVCVRARVRRRAARIEFGLREIIHFSGFAL